jgi:hypothetical protein
MRLAAGLAAFCLACALAGCGAPQGSSLDVRLGGEAILGVSGGF